MERLTFGKLKDFVRQNNMILSNDTEIFLGDDEELNGIHGSFFIQVANVDEFEDVMRDYDKPTKKYILIS